MGTTPRWFMYFVIVAMGLAFTMTLVTIAWNNALEKAQRDFSLASQVLKDNVTRDVRVGHNSANSLSAFLAADPDINAQQFDSITSSLLGNYSFIQAVAYCAGKEGGGVRPGEAGDNMHPDELELRYMNGKDGGELYSCGDIFQSEYSRDAAPEILRSDLVHTLPANGQGVAERNYWLLKRVAAGGNPGGASGLVAILMDVRSLLGTEAPLTNLSLTLLSDSASLKGMERLYTRQQQKDTGLMAMDFSEETITQFPAYSVKLSINDNININDMDMELVYNSLLIGIGVTMLMIALVRTRDKQERQLRERNIVIEKQVEEQTKELAKARDKALDASRVKSDFLASMSHEIRTPLNAIIGMSQLLSETQLTSEQKKYTDVFSKAGDTLLSLVNDILDLSKIEAGQLELEEIDFDLLEVLEESLEIYALKAAEKGVELYCEIMPGVNHFRRGDPSRLRQIILNLVSNALKFTEQGEIVVRVRKGGDRVDDHLHFVVTDTGIGIPPEKLESIFESFSQVDSSTTRKYGGTGLGLSICRSLVDLMQGRIWVESEVGKGSRFQFMARLPLAENVPADTAGVPELEGKRILVVDDNATGREIISALLQSTRAEVESASTADEVLQRLDDGNRYDLALVDYRMPGMDGLMLSGEIKSRDSKLPVLLMTDSAGMNQSVRETGIHNHDGYLVKPVKQKDLYQQVGSILLEPSAVASTETRPEADLVEKPLSILLVDDNADNRMLVRAFLKKLPYQLDEAENGEEAVTKTRDNHYDLVLMDVQMPVMDGRMATRKIRQREQESGSEPVPIIALTAHAIQEEIDQCLQAGCDAHLGKPVKKAVLLETIQKYA